MEVVAAQDDALERELTILWLLERKRYEVFDFRDLCRFFHDDIVVVEAKLCYFLPPHRSVC